MVVTWESCAKDARKTRDVTAAGEIPGRNSSPFGQFPTNYIVQTSRVGLVAILSYADTLIRRTKIVSSNLTTPTSAEKDARTWERMRQRSFCTQADVILAKGYSGPWGSLSWKGMIFLENRGQNPACSGLHGFNEAEVLLFCVWYAGVGIASLSNRTRQLWARWEAREKQANLVLCVFLSWTGNFIPWTSGWVLSSRVYSRVRPYASRKYLRTKTLLLLYCRLSDNETHICKCIISSQELPLGGMPQDLCIWTLPLPSSKST